MSGLQQMRQQSMELGRQEGMEKGLARGIERGMEKGIEHEKQEVVRTLTRFAEKGIISQEAMQTILSKL